MPSRLATVSLVTIVGLVIVATSAGFVGTAAAASPSCVGDLSDFASGDGSSGSPYQLTSVEQLQCVGSSAHLDQHFVLNNNIDASETSSWNSEAGFKPIGDSSNKFTGTFDGADHTISGLTINRSPEDYVGLFGFVGDGGTIENVGVENAAITGEDKLGGLVGQNNGAVTNSYVTGSVTGSSTQVGGLVGYNDQSTVSDSYATADVSGRNNFVGGLVGKNDGSTITNSYATGSATGSSDYVGGLVGSSRNTFDVSSSISKSYATGSVSGNEYVGGLVGSSHHTVSESYAAGSVSGVTEYVGGLVGFNHPGGDVSSSSATGDVTGGRYVGGLVGYNDQATITTSYATGGVSSDNSQVGGLVGVDFRGTISDSYWDVGTTNQKSAIGQFFSGSTSSLTGFGSVGDTTPAPEMVGINATVRMVGLDFSSTWRPGDGDGAYPDLASDSSFADSADAFDTLVAGDGTSTSPYQIEHVYDLQTIRERVGNGEQFVLANNVDASATSAWFGGSGFEPIGDSNVNFTGTFDGAGHTVSGLTISRSAENYVGLFGYVDSLARVKNVDVENVDVTGNRYVGGLVGYNNQGTITDASATGTVSGTNGDFSDVGGLIGYSAGQVTDSSATASVSGVGDVGGLIGWNDAGGTVINSSATGPVTGSTENVGGLVGFNRGTVTNSSATGDVDASGSLYSDVGGLVGQNDGGGTVTKSYATGSVSGVGDVGGLVGYNYQSTVKKSYATGSVTGSGDYVGGLVGYNNGPVTESYATGPVSGNNEYMGGLVGENVDTVSDSYWDIGTTTRSSAIGSDTGTTSGLTGFGSVDDTTPASEMVGINATVRMTALDFSTAWRPGGSDDAYPDLAWDSSFAGSADAFNALVAGDGTSGLPYQIEHVYDLQGIRERVGNGEQFTLANDISASATSAWSGGNGFEPIGDATTAFTGTFNGSDHTISGLTISRSTENNVGLFGYVGGEGVVENVGVENVDITGDSYVSGLVGDNQGGTVANSYATGSVTGTGNYLGGLVGRNNHGGTVTNSSATASVTGSSSTSKIVGGLAGRNYGTVTNSSATGSIDGNLYVGGLLGVNDAIVNESYATGSVTAGNDGGFSRAGGLVGMNYGGAVTESYATGSVSGSGIEVGGLIGWNRLNGPAIIDGSYAIGSVAGSGDVGGLVGKNGGTVDNGYWDTESTGQPLSAGSPDANGLTTAQMQRFAPLVTMDGFSFESPQTWLVTSGYPVLAWQDVTELTVDSVEATSPTVGEDESGTITVTATESGANAGRGVTIEVRNDDDLAGFATGDTRITDSNGQVTFTLNEATSGTYTPEFTWANDTSVSATSTVTIQNAPEVASIARVGDASNPTNANSLEYTVVFSESISGVDTGDFTLTQVNGDVSGVVSMVRGSANSYTVTVESVLGDGALRLDLLDDDSITNVNNVPLGGVGTSGGAGDGSNTAGEAFTLDNTAPSLSDDSGSTDEDTSVEIVSNLLSNDNDVTSLSVTAIDGSASNIGNPTAGDSGGLFTIASDGTVNFDPNGEFESLKNGDTATTQLAVTIADIAENTNTQTVMATVTGVDDPPILTTSSGKSSYTTASSGVGVDDNLTVTDIDGGTLNGARVSIDSGFEPTEDTLSYNSTVANNRSLSGEYDAGLGILTFTGSASLADVQAVLRTVTYDNRESVPTEAAREIMFTLGSGGPSSVLSSKSSSMSGQRSMTIAIVPEVVHITRSGTQNPTSSNSVRFNLTFSEPVTGVDVGDISLRTTDTVTVSNGTASVSVTGRGSNYTITVTNIRGNGEVGIDVVDNDSVVDSDGNPLGGSTDGGYTTGETFSIDNTKSERVTVYVLTDNTSETGDDSPSPENHVVTGTPSTDGSVSFAVADFAGDGAITLDVRGTGTDSSQSATNSEDSDVRGNTPAEAPALDQLSVTLTESASREFSISTRVWPAESWTPDYGPDGSASTDLQGTTDSVQGRMNPGTFLNGTGAMPVGNIELAHTNPDTDIENVTFRFRVPKAYLTEKNVAPSGFALYRNEAEGWARLPTAELDENERYHIFESTSPGLSLFIIGSAEPVFMIEHASSQSVTHTVSEPVTVDATVRNLGGAAGVYTAELRANGTVVASSEVELAPNATRRVELSFKPATPGEYTLLVGQVSAGSVSVQAAEEPEGQSQTVDETMSTEPTTAASGAGFGLFTGVGALLVVVLISLCRRG